MDGCPEERSISCCVMLCHEAYVGLLLSSSTCTSSLQQHDTILLMCAAGFAINERLWVWQAIKWVEFANPLTSDVSTKNLVHAQEDICY